MQILSRYTPWQIEMAVTASLFELGLFNNEKWVVDYVHWLLNNSYYDDELLTILDDDPLYPNSQYNSEALRKAWTNLGFPEVAESQAKWIYSHLVINCYATKPINYDIFNIINTSIFHEFYDFVDEDSCLQDVEKFKDIIYILDDALGNVSLGYVQNGYNDPKTVLAMKIEFFDLCQQWINTHQNKIASIFATLYP